MVVTFSADRYPVYFRCKVRTARSSTVVYRLIHNGFSLFFVYKDKIEDHVRIAFSNLLVIH